MKNPIERLSDLLIKGDSQSAALVFSDRNRRYLCEFKSSAGAIFITSEKAYLMVDFRYSEAARLKSKYVEVIDFKSMETTIKELIEKHSIKNVYMETENLPYAQAMKFKSACEEVGASAVLDSKLDDSLKALRIIKSPVEVAKIEAAQEITDAAFEFILTKIKEGVSELEIALDLEFFMKKQGAEDLAFTTIVVAGTNGSQCHGNPSKNTIKKGDFITIDMGAKLDGYNSDMTRTVACGEVGEEQRDIYETTLKAHLEVFKAAKPGVPCNSIDKIARDIIDAKYPERFGHGLGHGVGFDIHEWPRFSPADSTLTEAGMVITNEPGIYIPGKYGVRIEDMLLITENGCRSLTKSPKELIIL